MWKQLIESYTGDFTSFPPATEEQIAKAEETLGNKFPKELKSLLLESNGILGSCSVYGLVWSIENIVKVNLEYRQFPGFKSLYMPFDHLLFFSDVCTSDLFGYAVLEETEQSSIFQWEHETDSRTQITYTLKKYLELRLSDKIEH